MASHSSPVTFDMLPASLVTPPPSHPPSPMHTHAELPLTSSSILSLPPYTPKADSAKSESGACDLEKGRIERAQTQLQDSTTSTTQDQMRVKLSPAARVLLIAKLIIPMTALLTALSFPFGASSALLGTHILSWQWPAYMDILSWGFIFPTVLCGCAVVGCFVALVLGLLYDSKPVNPSPPANGAETFGPLISFGVFISIFALSVGALALHDGPLDIPPSLTPARALAANATGMVVLGCMAGNYMAIRSLITRRETGTPR